MSPITRRGFLKTTTLAVGATALGGRSEAVQSPVGFTPIHARSGGGFGHARQDGHPDVGAGVRHRGMKIYGGWGYGPQNRAKRFESLKYVLGLGTIHAFTIGFSKIEQLDETLALIEEAVAV
jgi:hypothetical protein